MPYAGTITIKYITNEPLSRQTVPIIIDEVRDTGGHSSGHFKGEYIETECSQDIADALIRCDFSDQT